MPSVLTAKLDRDTAKKKKTPCIVLYGQDRHKCRNIKQMCLLKQNRLNKPLYLVKYTNSKGPKTFQWYILLV